MKRNIEMEQRIADVEEMTMQELKDMFYRMYGFDSGHTSIRNLRKRLIYKIQEQFLGGLSADDLKMIEEIAKNDPLANLQPVTKKVNKITNGTRFCREWKGRRYEVIVLSDGQFEFDGVRYRSLSSIADKITGTHWNGKKFFGVV